MNVVYIVGGIFATLAVFCCGGGYLVYYRVSAPDREHQAEVAAERKIATNMTKQVLAGNGITGQFTVDKVAGLSGNKIITGEVVHNGGSQRFECEFSVKQNGTRSTWDILRVKVGSEEIYTKPVKVEM